MKNFFLIAILLVSAINACSPLYAQTEFTIPSVWLGVHGGGQSSTFLYDPPVGGYTRIKSKTGVVMGAEVNYWFSNHFGICGQVSYVEKGAKSTSMMIGINGSFEVTSIADFSYLQLPVLLKAILPERTVKPFLVIGPEVGLKLSATTTSSGRNVQETPIDLPDSEVTAINIGILGGIGVSYSMNPTTELYFSAAYNYGLTNLNAGYGKEDENGIADKQKYFSRDIRLSIGVLFALTGSPDTMPVHK